MHKGVVSIYALAFVVLLVLAVASDYFTATGMITGGGGSAFSLVNATPSAFPPTYIGKWILNSTNSPVWCTNKEPTFDGTWTTGEYLLDYKGNVSTQNVNASVADNGNNFIYFVVNSSFASSLNQGLFDIADLYLDLDNSGTFSNNDLKLGVDPSGIKTCNQRSGAQWVSCNITSTASNQGTWNMSYPAGNNNSVEFRINMTNISVTPKTKIGFGVNYEVGNVAGSVYTIPNKFESGVGSGWGEYVVSTGKNITLGGNLTIQNGGALYMDGCSLVLNATQHGNVIVDVQTGGVFNASNSNITNGPYNLSANYLFWASSADINLTNSEVYGSGYKFSGTDGTTLSNNATGFYIDRPTAAKTILKNVTFSDGYVGLTIFTNNLVDVLPLENLTFRNNTYAGLLLGRTESGASLRTTNYLVRNSTFTKNGYGILLSSYVASESFENVTIENNTIQHNTLSGILANRSVNISIVSNIIFNNSEYGVYFWEGNDTNFRLNNVTNNTFDGIYLLSPSRGNRLDNNNASLNRAGLNISFQNNTVQNITASFNRMEGMLINATNMSIATNDIFNNSARGVWFKGGHHITFENNNVSYNGRIGTVTLIPDSGMYFDLNGFNITVRFNNVTANEDSGIDIQLSRNHSITNNTLSKNLDRGIDIADGNDTYISFNNVTNNSNMGIRVVSPTRGIFINKNNVSANLNDGIRLFTNITVTNNTISFNGAGSLGGGIYADSGVENATITKNDILNNTLRGIWLQKTAKVTIESNEIAYNKKTGIRIDDDGTNPSTNITLKYNNVSSNLEEGILIEQSSNITLLNNTANYNLWDGVAMIGTTGARRVFDIIINNLTTSSNERRGLNISDFVHNNTVKYVLSTGNTREGFYIGGDYEVAENMHTANNTIFNLTSKSNTLDGVKINNTENNVFENITSDSNTLAGINLTLASRNNSLKFIVAISNSMSGAIDAGKSNFLTNLTSKLNSRDGLTLVSAINSTITNLIASSNVWSGLNITGAGQNVTILTSSATHNERFGVWLDGDNNTFTNFTANSNLRDGFYLDTTSNNWMVNLTAWNNTWSGINVSSLATNNTFRFPLTTSNTLAGAMVRGVSTYLINLTSQLNSWDGVELISAINTTVTNLVSSSNTWSGLNITDGQNHTIRTSSATHNSRWGIFLGGSNNTFTNFTAKSNLRDGLHVGTASNNYLINLTGWNNTWNGANISSLASNTTMDYTLLVSNSLNGLMLWDDGNYILNATANSNTRDGVVLINAKNNTLTNVSAGSNTWNGLNITGTSSNTTVKFGFFRANDRSGALVNATNATLLNSTAKSNLWDGIALLSATNASIENNTVELNTWNGINITYSNNNTIHRNIANDNTKYGINIEKSLNNTLTSNSMDSNTLENLFVAGIISEFNQIIDTSNTIGGNAVQYFYDVSNKMLNSAATSYISFVKGTNITLSNLNVVRGDRIYLADVNYSTIKNVTAEAINLTYGIQATFSYHNLFTNLSLNSSTGYGIYLNQSDNNTVNSSIFFKNTISNIWLAYSKNNTIVNSTFTSAALGKDFNLTNSSYDVVSLNNSFARQNVSAETGSNLTVKWFFNVKVQDTGGTSLSSATVTTKNISDDQIHSQSTDSSGLTGAVILDNYITTPSSSLNLTDHVIGGSKSGNTANNSNNVTVNRSFTYLLVLPTTTTTTTQGGGGGGSSSGTPIPSSLVVTDRAVFRVSGLSPTGATETSTAALNIPIKKISIAVKEDVRTASVEVAVLGEKPTAIKEDPAPPTQIYNYIEFTPAITLKNVVTKANVTFVVEKSWIEKNNIDKERVYLKRYNKMWEKLETSIISEDSKEITYIAETTGFSTFAIVGDKIGAPTTTTILPGEETTTTTLVGVTTTIIDLIPVVPAPEDIGLDQDTIWIGGGLILAGLFIVAVAISRTKKKNKPAERRKKKPF